MLHAAVLGNRAPPWGIVGGVFDAMRDAGGSVEAVDSAEARQAGALFEECEGLDLDPAAEVALAGLARAVQLGVIPRHERVLLNLTGGGSRGLRAAGAAHAVIPDLLVGRGPGSLPAVEEALEVGA
jgi:cysteate synthase